MSRIHLYSDIVLSNVKDILWDLNERGGKISHAFLEEKFMQHRGYWAIDCINIAMACIDAPLPYKEGQKSSPKQFEIFVEKAKWHCRYEISAVKAKRAEIAAKKQKDAAMLRFLPIVRNWQGQTRWIDSTKWSW